MVNVYTRSANLWLAAAGHVMVWLGVCLTLVSCGGGGSGGSTPPIVSPTGPQPHRNSLSDYPTYGFDNARDGFNPNSTAFTPAGIGQLHLAWQSTVDQSVQLSASQTQPIVATGIAGHVGVIIVGGVNGDLYGFDALNGAQIWSVPSLGEESYICSYGGSQQRYIGVGGTPAYDPASRTFYVTANSNVANSSTSSATNTLYRFDAATGGLRGSVNLSPAPNANEIDFAHTAVTISPSGLLYVGIGSSCDVSNTRGQIVAVNPVTMSIADTFYTTWNQGGPYAGGGVWGWGGVSLDASGSIYAASGNTWDERNRNQIAAPFTIAPNEQAGYGEHMLKLTPNLSLTAAHAPTLPFGVGPFGDDLDFGGTPTLFQPLGCNVLAAAQGKSGQLLVYDTTNIAGGPVVQDQLSLPAYYGAYLGNPAYSPLSGLLYVNVGSAQGGSLRPPGLIALQPSAGCGSFSILWSAAYGPDSFAYTQPITRGVPTVTAGGVVFASTPCTPDGQGDCGAAAGAAAGAVWAIDAASGQILNSGKPVIITPGPIRMAPTVDGNWVYVYDLNGDLYGLTIDPSIATVAQKHRKTLVRNMSVPSR